MEHCNSSAEVSLVVLAAGLGKRFGGEKQLAGVGRTGKPLMYFSVMDAWRAGVRSLVLVINADVRRAIENDFLPLLPEGLQVSLVEQGNKDIPAASSASPRSKPWGTAHALWCARDAVSGRCLVINADDYYGPGSFVCLLEHFAASSSWAMVAFPLKSTLSDHGKVSRGLCEVRDGRLLNIQECHGISLEGEAIRGELDDKTMCLPADTPVSMNIWGFAPDIFGVLERGLVDFFSNTGDLKKDECYLPELIRRSIREGTANVDVYDSQESWYGITYRDDLERLGMVFDAYE